ncbi:hypothetical protein HT136_18480 [Novosphingobium profundi]|uniref:hypothetical protein n=1 Tax=Novosphingobium profundi TaxID=1774954 RepID=UPI001BD9FCC5|nr:hypothetical protein [Novosphingobium profundi]MBT0670357.1 hypothetical protein [Novosphingobium profundi]
MPRAPQPLALSAFAAVFALAACSQGEPRPAPPVSPAARVIGEASDCLALNSFSGTRIRDDYTIDFTSPAGGKVWRVTLPQRCPGLRSADSFTYETSLSQLCRTDIIYPLMRYGNRFERGPGCGLAPFVPVTLEK